MSFRLVVLSDSDQEAARALDNLQVRKDRSVFIEQSIKVGEHLGAALLENEESLSSEQPTLYYKLRDSRYVWHGLRKAIPDAVGYGIYTRREGAGNADVHIDGSFHKTAGGSFLGFLDPMLARGTTALAVSERITGIYRKRVSSYATLHCFAAEEGISYLQSKISDFCKDYLLIVGRRGFRVDDSGYMGAIRREMDWGDVQDGTYFYEYPAEKEVEIVLEELATSFGMDILMATILLLLRVHEQHLTVLHPRDPALPTDGWLHTVLRLLKQEEYPVLASSRDWNHNHYYPKSEAVADALEQLSSEDMIRRFVDEAYPTYGLTVWGKEYLEKIYIPVLAVHADGQYHQLIDATQEIVERYLGTPFSQLVRVVKEVSP